MTDILFSPIRLNELETLIQNSVARALKAQQNSKKDSDVQSELLTIKQAAEFLSLAVPTIYSKVSRGELPVMKREKRLYFSRQELIEYLKAGRKKTIKEIEAEADQYLINNRKPEKNINR